MPASIPSPCLALYRFNYSPLLLQPSSLALVTHRQSKPVLDKSCCENVGKADKEDIAVKRSLGRAKY